MAITTTQTDGSFYHAFEDKFRGTRALIKARLGVYRSFAVPLLNIDTDAHAVDLGCGRGEWLELLCEWGFQPFGIDQDAGMLSACHELGLKVEVGDAIAYIRALPTESQVLVSALHLVEHLRFEDLRTLVSEALRVLKPGGLLIMETPNPENLTVGTASFYLDPTHQRPLPPALLSFLPEHYGFARTKILRLQEAPGLSGETTVNLEQVIEGASPDYAVVAQKACDAPEILALFDQPFSQSFGVDLGTLAKRYDQTVTHKLSEILARVDRSLEFEARENAARADLVQTRELLATRDTDLTLTRELLAARDTELTQTRELLATRSAELRRLQAREQSLQNDLQAVLESRSWRVTQPLRTLSGFRVRISRSVSRLMSDLITLPRRTARRALTEAMTIVIRNVKLKSFTLRCLAGLPGLRGRLRAFAEARGLLFLEPTGQTQQSTSVVSKPAVKGPVDVGLLTPRARQIFYELKSLSEHR